MSELTLNLIKEKRLKIGLNITHTDLRENLLVKICTPSLLDEVMSYVELRLEKEYLDGELVKLHFVNHYGEDDVMYFDIKYAEIFDSVD